MHRIKDLKAAKPAAYDVSFEEWQKLQRAAEAEGQKVYQTFIRLCYPFENLAQLKTLIDTRELSFTTQVKTCPSNGEEAPSQMITVCQVEHKVWRELAQRLVSEGYEKRSTTILIDGVKRTAHWCEKLHDQCMSALAQSAVLGEATD